MLLIIQEYKLQNIDLSIEYIIALNVKYMISDDGLTLFFSFPDLN